MAKLTINGKNIDTSKRKSGQSEREYVATVLGISKEEAQTLLGTQEIKTKPGHTISPDAQKAMENLSQEAKDYIISQDFGGELTSGEVKSLNSKWIDASNTNSATKENLAVYNLPKDAFGVTIPQLVPGTPEYQSALDNINTAYFDVLQQQLNATTEQEKAVADYNWNTLKSGIEKNLNVSLSNDSFQAWNQLQGLKGQYAQQNIENSGIQNESVDNYLASVRRNDSLLREDAVNKNKSGELEYYTKFATPDQIKALVNSDPAKAQSFGLIPSAETKTSLSFAKMKEQYPTMADEEINRNISTVLDTNGNYRSSLYQKYMTGNNAGVNTGAVNDANSISDQYGNAITVDVKPTDTGYMDIQSAKRSYQKANAPLSNLLKDYKSRVALGSIQPTAGTTSTASDATLFNKITPTKNTTPMLPGL